jgi:hypothetical protein
VMSVRGNYCSWSQLPLETGHDSRVDGAAGDDPGDGATAAAAIRAAADDQTTSDARARAGRKRQARRPKAFDQGKP